EVSEEEADRYFYMQVLTGDPTDGYSGCPGIGPKRAERLLDGVGLEDMWSVIVETYEAKGLTEEDALQQARVARILRKNDYDFKNKSPMLWAPFKLELPFSLAGSWNEQVFPHDIPGVHLYPSLLPMARR